VSGTFGQILDMPENRREVASRPVSTVGERAGRRRPGELEAQILGVLTRSGTALSPGELRDQLSPDGTLSYSAVVTTLTRLHEKKAVVREKDGRAYRYTAVADATTLVARRMGRLLDAEADHASVLSHFVNELTKSDAEVLRALLDREPGDH
jgi:predicted transcriptional regulator